MKKVTLFAVAAFALFSFVKLETSTWSSDNVHSNLGFTINHLGINDVHGQFNNYESKITASKADFSDAVIELSAETASINTGNSMRDDHLKTAEFFDAANNAKITFKSTSFTKVKDNNYKVEGDLTLHGVTNKVTLTAVYNGTTTHPMNKKTMAGFKIFGVIKRSDYKLATGMPTAVISDEVKINADVEYSKN